LGLVGNLESRMRATIDCLYDDMVETCRAIIRGKRPPACQHLPRLDLPYL